LANWGRAHYVDFPWRSTKNSFHALVAEIMLQRTKAEQVVPVYTTFASLYPTAKEASSANPEELLEILAHLGLRWRAKKISDLAGEICRRGNVVPKEFEELVALPGVGAYAACAYLSFHVGKRAIIVDTNAVRLWTRIFGLTTRKEMRRNKEFLCLVDNITPAKGFRVFNYAVLDHTRTVCKQKPLCGICPVNSLCSYYLATQSAKE
jgi:A/G-specific adenine glycosylase